MNKLNYILIGIIFLVTIILISKCNSDIQKNYEQNIYALTDSLFKTQNKAKELEYEKGVLIASKNDLEALNNDLYKELKKEKGIVTTIIKELVRLQIDTVVTTDTIIKTGKGEYILKWVYDTTFSTNNYIHLSGQSNLRASDSSVSCWGTKIKADITTSSIFGIKKENGKLKMFVRFDNPLISCTDLNGVVISDNKELKNYKRFGIGFQFGTGISKNFKPAVYFGIGLQYTLFRF